MCPTDRRSPSPIRFLRGDVSGATSAVGCLRPVFNALDTDRDGRISADDLRQSVALVRTRSGLAAGIPAPITEADIGPMMAAADADRSGYVEYEEFERVLTRTRQSTSASPAIPAPPGPEWLKEVFRALDRDGDGVIGPRDLAAWLAAAGLPASDEDVRSMIAAAGPGVDGGVGFEGMVRVLAPQVPAAGTV